MQILLLDALHEGKPDPHNWSRPLNDLRVTERLLELAGVSNIEDE
jgi:hypothetical protein